CPPPPTSCLPRVLHRGGAVVDMAVRIANVDVQPVGLAQHLRRDRALLRWNLEHHLPREELPAKLLGCAGDVCDAGAGRVLVVELVPVAHRRRLAYVAELRVLPRDDLLADVVRVDAVVAAPARLVDVGLAVVVERLALEIEGLSLPESLEPRRPR